MPEHGIVIVGAGEAGVRAALALRKEFYHGPVTLLGRELHSPYERPPLSKHCLTGEPRLPAIADAARFAEHHIRHVTGVDVASIDRAAHRLATADGRSFAYDRLCLATGALPRRLTIPGAEAALYLRHFDDVAALRERLVPGALVVVIGGGFIGLELAASAYQRGCRATVIEMAPRLLMRGVPGEISEAVAAYHGKIGNEILTGVSVAGIDRAGGRHSVRLADGRMIEADAVIAGIGAVPDTALAAGAGLALDNGIAVDARLTTSDPDIFAAGDCVSFPHTLYGGRRIRLEAWRNAQDQGALVARAMLGRKGEYVEVPWFWSDQHDLHLQVAGLVDEGRTDIKRDIGRGAVVLFHLAADGRLVAASGVGRLGQIAKDIRVAEMLIARRAKPDPAALADTAFKLKGLLAT